MATSTVENLYGGHPLCTDGIPTPNSSVGTPKAKQLVAQHERYKKSIEAAIDEGARGDVIEIGRIEGQSIPRVRSKRVYQKELAAGIDQSGLQKGHREIQAEHLQHLENTTLRKEWTLTNPIPTGLVPYDLEAPSKNIWPKPTPLRNSVPRVRGQGSVRRFKVINAVSNSGTGGITTINPGIAEGVNVTTPTGQSLVRGPAISQAGYDVSQTYVTSSLSDYVTWQAEFEGLGFDDIRSLSATSLLYSSMLAEERLYLYGRGTTANGYVGPLSAPASVTYTGTNASVSPAGTSSLSGTYWCVVAADAGDLQTPAGAMHQGPSTVAASVSVTAGQAIKVSVGGDVTGALGYNLFVGSVSSGPFYYAGRTGYATGYITSQPSTGPQTTSGAADASALSTNYDGFFSNLGASAGYSTRLNAPLSLSNPGQEFQTAFASLYDASKADPDEVWLNGFDRLQLSNALLQQNSPNAYRVFIDNSSGSEGVKVGAVVQSLLNEVTGKEVAVNTHPWIPQGNAMVRSVTLPMPQTNISETTVLATPQDFMQIQWPAIQFSYDSSIFWVSSLCHYAPSYSAIIQGIQGASGVPQTFPSFGDS